MWLIVPNLLFALLRHPECTPEDAVFCDDGLSCQSGTTGYTCGEFPRAVVVFSFRIKSIFVGVVCPMVGAFSPISELWKVREVVCSAVA